MAHLGEPLRRSPSPSLEAPPNAWNTWGGGGRWGGPRVCSRLVGGGDALREELVPANRAGIAGFYTPADTNGHAHREGLMNVARASYAEGAAYTTTEGGALAPAVGGASTPAGRLASAPAEGGAYAPAGRGAYSPGTTAGVKAITIAVCGRTGPTQGAGRATRRRETAGLTCFSLLHVVTNIPKSGILCSIVNPTWP